MYTKASFLKTFDRLNSAHLGDTITRGPGLSMIEAIAVTAEGHFTPKDSGLWKDP